jgi:hypothetical protein
MSAKKRDCARISSVAAILLGWALSLQPVVLFSEVQVSEQNPALQSKPRTSFFNVAGDISGRYRFRTADGFETQTYRNDLVQAFQLDISIPSNEGLGLHVAADAKEVLGGIQYSSAYAPLKGLTDAWAAPINGNLYEAYFDIGLLSPLVPLLRFGRQAGMRGESLYFDGVTAELGFAGMIDLILYAGLAVHFYEIDYIWGTDGLAGVGIGFHPLEDTRLDLDYVYVADTRAPFLGADQGNHLLSLGLWQRLFSLLRLEAGFRMMNLEPRDLVVSAACTLPVADIDLTAGYAIRFLAQSELANEFSVYYDVAGRSAPFHSFDVKARRQFGPNFAVDAGLHLRGLLPGETESPFNRQYGKACAEIELIDLPLPGISMTVPGEVWKSGDNLLFSSGLGITWRDRSDSEVPSIEMGTYFSLFKYDYYALMGERENVQTYYAKVRVPLGRFFSLHGDYEFEQGLQSFHDLSLEMRGAW